MFEANPELLNMFNQTNQKKGRQSAALAQAVLAAAMNINNLGAIKPAIMLWHISTVLYKFIPNIIQL